MTTKNMRILSVSLILFYVLLISKPAMAGGGWVRSEGTGYVKMYSTFMSATKAYDFDGKTYPLESYSETGLRLYGEYGLVPELTLIADIPAYIKYETQLLPDTDVETVSGFGDPMVGFSYGVFQQSAFPVSVSVKFVLPVASSGRSNNPVPLGQDEFKTSLELAVSHSIDNFPGFWSLYTGATRRQLNRNHEILAGGEFGWMPVEKVWLFFKSDLKLPIGKIQATDSAINGGGNGVKYLGLSAEVNYTFYKNIGFSYGFRTAAMAANIVAAPLHVTGLYMEF